MPRTARTLSVLLLVALGTACGSDGADETDSLEPAPNDCASGEYHVVVDLETHQADLRGSIVGYMFTNKVDEDPGEATLDGENVTIHYLFDVMTWNGAQSDARGSLTTDTFTVGNCLEDGESPGIIGLDDDGEGGRFVFRQVREDGSCDGAELTGTVSGCYRTVPFEDR